MSALLGLGTLGFHVVEGWAWFDSFYMALITLTTVGYGELYPLSTGGRVFASVLMLSGVTVTFVSIAILADLVIKMELADYFGRKRSQRMFDQLSNHYIVCGAGRVGRAVIDELRRSGVGVALIDHDKERAQWAIDQGVPTLVADATRDDTLREARIDLAKGLVAAISTDAENVYVTLSARASADQAEDKLRTAGASTVLKPYPFIGHRLALSLLQPHVLCFLDVASAFGKTSDKDLEIGQVCVSGSSKLASKTLEESGIRRAYGVIVLAIQKPSAGMLFNPDSNTRIDAGDFLIAMVEGSDLKRMESDFD
jgi:voltage-gated potassium channel